MHADLIAATLAGANVIGKVGIDQTTPGTTNGVVLNTSFSIIGNILRSTPYSDTTAALGASATFSGTARDSGPAGNATQWNTFSCFARADQAGTLNQQGSADASTWFTEATTTLSANISSITTVRIFARYHRCQVVNGTFAQGSLVINSQFGE